MTVCCGEFTSKRVAHHRHFRACRRVGLGQLDRGGKSFSRPYDGEIGDYDGTDSVDPDVLAVIGAHLEHSRAADDMAVRDEHMVGDGEPGPR